MVLHLASCTDCGTDINYDTVYTQRDFVCQECFDKRNNPALSTWYIFCAGVFEYWTDSDGYPATNIEISESKKAILITSRCPKPEFVHWWPIPEHKTETYWGLPIIFGWQDMKPIGREDFIKK